MKVKIGDKTFEIDDEKILAEEGKLQEEITIESDGLVMRTKEEDDSFRENAKTEGMTAGTEIGRKEVLKGIGIEVNGQHKSDASAIDAIKAWNSGIVDEKLKDADKEPDAKIMELEKDKGILQNRITELETQNTEITGKFDTFKKQQSIDAAILGSMPDNLAIPKEGMLTIIKQKQNFDVDENGQVFG